jgi:hypothetical protein
MIKFLPLDLLYTESRKFKFQSQNGKVYKYISPLIVSAKTISLHPHQNVTCELFVLQILQNLSA